MFPFDLDLETRKMRTEGSVLDRKRIIPALIDKKTGAELRPVEVIVTSTYINPRKAIIDTYTKNIIALRRNLSLHARAIDGEARDILQRRQKAKEIESGMKDDNDFHGLIPGVNAVVQ